LPKLKYTQPFLAKDDDDINAMLFGNNPPEEDNNLNLEGLAGDDLDSALAALMAADDFSSGNTETTAETEIINPTEPVETPESVDNTETIENIETSEIVEPAEKIEPIASTEEPESTLDPILGIEEPEEQYAVTGGIDLDSLLASLGGDDSLGGTASVTEELILPAVDNPEESADDILARMIAMDEQEDEALNAAVAAPIKAAPEDEWSEFYYDPTAEEVDPAEIEARRKAASEAYAAKRRAANKTLKQRVLEWSWPRIIATAATILLFIVGSGFAVAFGINQVYAARRDHALAIAYRIPISQPVSVTNDNHFINIGRSLQVGETEFILQRITAGNTGTAFHFANTFNPDNYVFVLYDQDDVLYKQRALNLDYILLNASGSRNAVLEFSPLDRNTTRFVLHIQEITSGITENFSFVWEDRLTKPRSVYMDTPKPLFPGTDENFVISNAHFSNISSQITYLRHTNPMDGDIIFRGDAIRMHEGSRSLTPNMPEPFEVFFPEFDVTLGTLSFGPVRNLDSNIRLNFNDVFVSYPNPSDVVDIIGLFRNEPQYQQIITLGNHNLVLERMGTHGPLVILVFHAINENGNRIRAEINADLTIRTETGNIVIPGDNFFSEQAIGTDLFFDTRPYGITEVSAADLSITVNSVDIYSTEASLFMQMQYYGEQPADSRRQLVENAIESAFTSRLAYKAGIYGFGSITGFSQAVFNDRALMRHYTPITIGITQQLDQAALDEIHALMDEEQMLNHVHDDDGMLLILTEGPQNFRTMFDVRVTAGSFINNNTFLAIVEESWVLEYLGHFYVRSNMHRATLQLQGNQWIITQNEIIS